MMASRFSKSPGKKKAERRVVENAADQNPNPNKLAQAIADLPTASLVENSIAVDAEGEIVVGEDNLVLLQMEITDRIK